MNRSELTPAQAAAHLARRKELWEAIQNNGTNCPENQERGRPEGFASNTAAVTGENKRDINRSVSRGEKIAPDVLDTVQGTDMDKGVELDALKPLTHDEQRQAVQRVASRVANLDHGGDRKSPIGDMNVTQAEAAEMRMADEIDAGQERGEVARPGGDRDSIVRTPDNGLEATYDELGISRQRVSEQDVRAPDIWSDSHCATDIEVFSEQYVRAREAGAHGTP